MYPSFQDDIARARIDELWRLAEDARRYRKAEQRREHEPRQWRRTIGRRLVQAGIRLGGEELQPGC